MKLPVARLKRKNLKIFLLKSIDFFYFNNIQILKILKCLEKILQI